MFGKGWPLIAFTVAMLTGWFVACTGAFSEALIEYRRSGGVAGLDDRLVIKENGESILTRKLTRSEFVLDSDTLNRLQTLFEEANFSQLRKEYFPPHPGADSLEYIVSYKGHTVRVVDGAVPPSLQPILETLNQIIEKANIPLSP